MKIFSSNNPLMTIVLVFLTIVLAIVVVPFLLIVAVCCLFSYIVMGISPLVFFNRNKERRHERIYEGPDQQVPPRDGAPGKPADDTIECEVISARTVGEESGEDKN